MSRFSDPRVVVALNKFTAEEKWLAELSNEIDWLSAYDE